MTPGFRRGILTLALAAIIGAGGCSQGVDPPFLLPSPLQITTTSPVPDGVDSRPYSFTFRATGGSGPHTWSLASGTLPAGMSFTNAGVLTGTPDPGTAGTYAFTVKVTDAPTDSRLTPSSRMGDFTLVIQAPLAILNPATLPSGVVGTPYQAIFNASGGLPSYTWSALAPTTDDPPGLSFTISGPTTGTYSGTPTMPGPFTFAIRVSDAGNDAVAPAFFDATFTVLILGAPAAFVTNSGGTTVSVVDLATNTVTGMVTVGMDPRAVALSPAGGVAYVANFVSNTVTVVDTLTSMMVMTIPVGTGPIGMVIPPDGLTVWVANQGSDELSVIDTVSNMEIARIPLPAGSMPTGLAASSDSRLIFVTLAGTGQVVVFVNDPTSPAFHTIIDIIGVGGQPTALGFVGVKSQLYVALSGSTILEVIDADLTNLTFEVQDEPIAVGSAPVAVGVGPNCNIVHVINNASQDASLVSITEEEEIDLDPLTATIDRIGLGSNPRQIAFNSDGSLAYVTDPTDNTVSVVDLSANTITTTIMGVMGAFGIAITPDPTLRLLPEPPPPSSQLMDGFVAEPYSARVCAAGGLPPYTFSAGAGLPAGLPMDATGLIDGEPTTPSVDPLDFTFPVTVTDSSGAPQSVTGDFKIEICCVGNPPLAYVANFSGNSVTVINSVTRTVATTITTGLGTNPLGVAIAADGTRTYVTNFNSDTVSVINSDATAGAAFNTVISTIAVGDAPAGLAVNGVPGPAPGPPLVASTRVYVANENAGTVSVIDIDPLSPTVNTVIATVTVGSQPEGVAVLPGGSKVYVANVFSGNVSVIETVGNTVMATVTVGSGPVGVAVTPDGGRVYVTNQFDSTVSVIETTGDTVTDTINVGSFPTGIAITPDGFRVYVANQMGDNVSVISTVTNAEIDATPADDLTFRIDVGDGPDFVAITQFGGRVYVTNFGSGNVSVINNEPGDNDEDGTVIETIAAGMLPEGIKIQRGR